LQTKIQIIQAAKSIKKHWLNTALKSLSINQSIKTHLTPHVASESEVHVGLD